MRHARIERERTMAMDVEALKAMDAHNSEHLAATMDMIREKNEEDVARTRTNAQVLRDLPKTEEKRWLDRQDDIRKTIKHEFGGNLPEIEQTVPYFIY